MKLKNIFSALIATGLVLISLSAWSEKAYKINDIFDESIVGVSARFIPINVEADVFEMGSRKDEFGRNKKNEQLHRVRLSNKFEIQATEVTQLQWVIVSGKNPSFNKEKQFCDSENYLVLKRRVRLCKNHPVEKITLTKDVPAFLEALNQAQNQYTYRLPTEAEWELAARGGTGSDMPYSFGKNDSGQIDDYAWHAENSNFPEIGILTSHAVAQKRPNPFGLYDIHGGVAEWTQDRYDTNYSLSKSELEDVVKDPVYENPVVTLNVIRGGSYKNLASSTRSAVRNPAGRSLANSTVGLRLVRVPR